MRYVRQAISLLWSRGAMFYFLRVSEICVFRHDDAISRNLKYLMLMFRGSTALHHARSEHITSAGIAASHA